MTKSERIKLIKEISNSLINEEWSLLDLTLKQFGFPILDSYSGDKFNYVIQQLQDGDDSDIVDLATHLNIIVNSSDSELNPNFWKDGFFRIFISHLASDKTTAQNLKEKLEKYAITGFVAHSDIEPTKEWQNEIELALRTCDSIVALMIPGFHESKWTDQEIGLALGRDLLIIPVRMGQDPYGFIGKFQAITYVDINTLTDDILTSLIKNKKTSRKISNSIIYKFENSDSFAEAKKNFDLVERLEYWDKKLIDRLSKSKDNNSQILHSFGVANRIDSLINKINKK
jgi:hypothetical protein